MQIKCVIKAMVILAVVGTVGFLAFSNPFVHSLISNKFVSKTNPSIGILHFDTCLTKSKHGLKGRKILEDINSKARSDIKEMDDRIQELQTKLQDEKLKDTLNESARSEMQNEWTSLRRSRDEKLGKSHSDVYKIQVKIVKKLSAMISDAAKVVSRAKGYDAIFNSEVCCFYKDGMNCTDEICEELEKMEEIQLEDFIEQEDKSSE